MRTIFIIFIVYLGFGFQTFSQQSVTVNGLADGKQWQIIEKAFYENGYKVGKFMPEENTILTNWIEWNVLTIQNRGLIQVELSGQDVTISMIQRSFKTKDTWDPAIGKLSKKNKKKYLQKLADKIAEINASVDMTANAVENSILFPTFKSITKVNGVEWRLDSISQHTDSPNKELMLFVTLTNTNSYPVTMEVNLWGEKEIFLGVQAQLKNYKADGKIGGARFSPHLNAGDSASGAFLYTSTADISRIPKFNLAHRVNNERCIVTIYDVAVPYNTK